MVIRFALLAVLGAVLSACCCLPEPTSDSTAPTAGIIVEYRNPSSGAVETVTLTAGDADMQLTVDNDREIAVLYSGSDNEGMRSVRLNYDMIRYANGQVIQPLLVEMKVDSELPAENLSGAHNFDPGGLDWNYEFQAQSENWVGAQTQSATLTVNAR